MTGSSKGSRRKKKNQLKPSHKEEVEADENAVDRISKLGNDILVSIIDRLTWKEATATSVLSTRWQPLHTLVSRLNFPPIHRGHYYEDDEYVIKKFKNYVKMFNRTLDSYKGDRAKEFKVHMYRLKGVNMMRWLEFAFAREVQIVDIRLDHLRNYDGYGLYGLQLEKLIRIKSRPTLQGLKCLRELSLSKVDVDDGDMLLLLSNSPNLESLSLERPDMLRNVSVVGHPKLQHFNISSYEVASIKIENMTNLVSLGFHRLPGTCVIRVNNVPKLIEFNEQGYGRTLLAVGDLFLFKLPLCILSQLLVVRLTSQTSHTVQYDPLPELKHVKHLEVEWPYTRWCTSVYALTKLIEACRSLEKFEMKNTSYWKGKFEYRDFVEYGVVRQECSPNLRRVKLWRYLGSQLEWEFAAFIIKYAASSLQELIVEPRVGASYVRKQLGPIIPDSINLVII